MPQAELEASYFKTGQKLTHCLRLTLACLEPAIGFVDHIGAALAANNAAIAMPVLQRFQ